MDDKSKSQVRQEKRKSLFNLEGSLSLESERVVDRANAQMYLENWTLMIIYDANYEKATVKEI